MRGKVLNLLAGQDRVSEISKAIAAFEYSIVGIRKHRDGFRGGVAQVSGSKWVALSHYGPLFQVSLFLSARMNSTADQYSDFFVRGIERLHETQGLSYQMKTLLLLPGYGRVRKGDE